MVLLHYYRRFFKKVIRGYKVSINLIQPNMHIFEYSQNGKIGRDYSDLMESITDDKHEVSCRFGHIY